MSQLAIDFTPTPDRFRRAPGDPRDYRAEWARFVEAKPETAAAMLAWAVDALAAGERRISVGWIVDDVRKEMKVSINHSWRAAMADWLIERDPRLAKPIERRARRTTK